MKIAIVSFNLFTAGGARLTFNMAHALQALGQQVIIYTPAMESSDFGDLTKGLDIRIVSDAKRITHFTGAKPRNIFEWIRNKLKHEGEFLDASRAIARAIDADCDGINVNDSSYRTAYFFKKRNPNARAVWIVNGEPFRYLSRHNLFYDIPGHLYQFIRQRTRRKFLRAIDAATVLAEHDRGWLDGTPIRNVAVVRAGLDFEKFYAPVKDITEKAKEKKINLLALGALNAARRYDNVLEAAKWLRDWGYRPHVTIVANNIWNENAYRDSLIAYVTENALTEYVDLRFNGVPEAELPHVYEQSDIFIHAVYVPPPGHHGWGLVNFEAMAAGLAVVLCDSSTATEVLHDGKDVLLVKPLAPKEIAEKIKYCIDHPTEYRRIAEAGQAVARDMRWEKYAEEMLAVFHGR
jgi:glycosyltransferase involved in cell wall biosynthesis